MGPFNLPKPIIHCLAAPEEEEKQTIYFYWLHVCCSSLAPTPVNFTCLRDWECALRRVLLVGVVGGHLPLARNVDDGCDPVLRWPQLLGLQIQDPNLLPGMFLRISAVSPCLAGLKWICLFSPFSLAPFQLHKIKPGPVDLVSRSAANFQLPTPRLFVANVQPGALPPRTFLSTD